MSIRRTTSKLLIEPPSVATGDIAFNLIVFFLVCASTQPDSGRKQAIPKSESKAQKEQQSDNVEVHIFRERVMINGTGLTKAQIDGGGVSKRIGDLLKSKSRPEDRVVVVKSAKETPYDQWIRVTGQIEKAGGIITLQLEEERTVGVP